MRQTYEHTCESTEPTTRTFHVMSQLAVSATNFRKVNLYDLVEKGKFTHKSLVNVSA